MGAFFVLQLNVCVRDVLEPDRTRLFLHPTKVLFCGA